MAKFKVGDNVRIVKNLCGHKFSIGEEVVVEGVTSPIGVYEVCSGGECWYVNEEEVEESSAAPCVLTLVANLSAEVAWLTKRVEALEEGGGNRKRYELSDLLAQYPSRKEIVERAKADVEAFRDSRGYYVVKINEGYWKQASCEVEFVVNREKRTVVALLRGCLSEDIYAKGIAKAAPDDCFNEHIGKAIALRRALGEEVPQEYTNAPPPEGVEVGDVVSLLNVGGEVVASNQWRKNELTRQVRVGDSKVIDDSDREVYAND